MSASFTSRVRALRAAHLIAEATASLIPTRLFDVSYERGFNELSTRAAADAIGELADIWAAQPHKPAVETFAGARSKIFTISYRTVTTLDRANGPDPAAGAYESAILAARDINPNASRRVAASECQSAWLFLRDAILHAERGRIDLCPSVGALYKVSAEHWPIFVTLLADGQLIERAAAAAALI